MRADSLIPHALLQPPIFPPTSLITFTPQVGPLAWILRALRLGWVLSVSLPLISFGAILSLFNIPALPAPEGRTRLSNIIHPTLSALMWAVTYGLLPSKQPEELSDEERRRKVVHESMAPKFSTWLYAGGDAAMTQTHALASTGSHSRGLGHKAVVIEKAEEKWCLGVIKVGIEGNVQREHIGATWLWNEGLGNQGDARAADDERVVLYFVGGGYISGTPTLGPFPYSALRSAPPGTTRLLALSYRLAKHPSHAFPGAIQDALAAWIYLTQHLGFRPENIILLGDSAGGGLAWSLTAYLSIFLDTTSNSDLGLPGWAALFSPWLDLTLSQPSFNAHVPFDIINAGQCLKAIDCYLPALSPKKQSSFAIKSSADLLTRQSFIALGRTHPLVSPASTHHEDDDILSPILRPLSFSGTRFFVHSGSLEIFSDEATRITELFRASGVLVEEMVEQGGGHCCGTIFPPWDGQGPLGRWVGIGKRSRRAMLAWRSWLEGGGSRECGGAGWSYGDD